MPRRRRPSLAYCGLWLCGLQLASTESRHILLRKSKQLRPAVGTLAVRLNQIAGMLAMGNTMGMTSGCSTQFQKVFEVQGMIRDIHPFLERLFPIALVEGDHFLIYDIEPHSQRYTLARSVATSMPIPQGVRAAFPLECYGNRMACVVTGDVFDALDGYVTIFHEFIHCQQAESCEQSLKQSLGVAGQAQDAGDFMGSSLILFPTLRLISCSATQAQIGHTGKPWWQGPTLRSGCVLCGRSALYRSVRLARP